MVDPSSATTAAPAPEPGPADRPSETTRREGTSSAASTILVTGLLTVIALYFLLPVYWVVVAATKSTEDLFGTHGFLLPSDIHLWENLKQVLTYDDGIFVRWFLNSILYAGVGGLVATYLAAAGGYALAKYQFRGREAVFGLILGGVLVPATATALPLFLFFSQMGFANTYWSVLVPSLVSPFGIFLCRIYAEATIPDALVEAARLDGAGELRIFHSLGLKAMVPAMVTVFLFQLVGIWNNYFLPLVMLSDDELYPITLGLSNWNSQTQRLPEFYELTTGGVLLSIIPLLVAMLVLQRYWRGDMTAGAVKE